MSLPVNIGEALADPALLGAALGPIETFEAWLAVLKAADGLPLDRSERRAFAAVSGSRKPPRQKVRELWAIVGRRAGKSRIAAAMAVFEALFVDHAGKLAPGETGYVLALAASKAQATTIFNYALAFIQSSPVLSQQLVSATTDEIRLAGNIVIAVHPNNFRTVRGRTLLAAIFDEVAYWRDETSAAPDIETYRAVLPALSTTGGPLIGISSPYRQIGLLHARFRDHFGKETPDILVVRGATEQFNPTIDRSLIRRAREDDPVAANAEWDGQFRADIPQFLDDAAIDAAIDTARPLELPPRAGVTYRAFTDASAARHDAFTLCIGHREDDVFVADVVRGRKPPFDPKSVAADYAALAREYGCREITGDSYAGEWVAGEFRDALMAYRRSDLTRSELYLEALPHFMRGAVRMPDIAQLVRELRLLERRTSRSGRDAVNHPVGGSDDYSNSLAGCLWLALRKPKYERSGVGGIVCGEARIERRATPAAGLFMGGR
jgi:hypothetical protein